MSEKVHITKRLDDGKTLCGISSCEWINAVMEWPAEDFCPECVAKLVAHLIPIPVDLAEDCPNCLALLRYPNNCDHCGWKRQTAE